MKAKISFLFFITLMITSCSALTSSSLSDSSISSLSSSIISSSSSVISSTSSSSSTGEEIQYIKTDLVRNGNFNNNINEWNVYNGGGNAKLSHSDSTLKIKVTSGWAIYEPRIDQMNIAFEQGKFYLIEYRARTNISSKSIQVQTGELLSYDPWFTNFGLVARVNLTTEWKTFQHQYYQKLDNKRGGIIFEIGYANDNIKDYEIYLDDIVIYEVIGVEAPNYDLRKVKGDKIVDYVPKIYLTTKNNQTIPHDKTVKIDGTFSLVDEVNEFVNIKNKTMKIKARGNSTLGMPKMAYKVEFDEKLDLYGMGANKDWILLANYADKSLMRNYLAFNLAKSLGLKYTPSSMFVDVYLNGLYNGVYMLATQIETGKSRVDIETNIAINDTEVPFLIEWDRRLTNPSENGGAIEGVDYFVVNGIPFGLKYPKTFNDITTKQGDYIKNYIQLVNDAIMSNYRYTQYIDIDSFIDYILVQELFKNVDMGYASVYLYKSKDGKLELGPVWDFDLALGNADYIDYTPYGWYSTQYSGNIWFYKLLNDPGFFSKFKARFNEVKDKQLLDLYNSVDIIGRDIYANAEKNFTKWKILGKYDWPNPTEVVLADTFDAQVYYVKNYIKERVKWMDEELNS
jgi:spore coat protein CotH